MGKRFFIVEDDQGSQAILKRVIRSVDSDAVVHWEKSAEAAMAALESESRAGRHYDLIIADIFLSGQGTGLDFWRACQKHHPKTPVLVTSGLPVTEFFDAIGKDTVAPPYLPKPYQIGECKQVIEGMLTYH